MAKNQAKLMKMKRARRSLPKSYSADYIAVGRGPNRDVMSEYKERSRSLAFSPEYLAYLEVHAKFHGKPPGKYEAEQTAKAMVNPKPQLPAKDNLLSVALNEFPTAWARIKDVCPRLMNVILENNMKRHVRMFWNEARTKYILLELNHIGRFMRCSMVYQDGERAKARFTSGQVRWVEFVSSSPPKPND